MTQFHACDDDMWGCVILIANPSFGTEGIVGCPFGTGTSPLALLKATRLFLIHFFQQLAPSVALVRLGAKRHFCSVGAPSTTNAFGCKAGLSVVRTEISAV